MGVDAEVWVRVDALTNEHIRALHERDLNVNAFVEGGYIIVYTCKWARYYCGGSRYSDYWPDLANSISVMREVFGHVYYTSDHMEFDYETYDCPWTEEDSARLWKSYNNYKEGGEE